MQAVCLPVFYQRFWKTGGRWSTEDPGTKARISFLHCGCPAFLYGVKEMIAGECVQDQSDCAIPERTRKKMTWRQDGHETSAQSRFMISCVNSVEKKDHLLFSFTQRLKELFFCFQLPAVFCEYTATDTLTNVSTDEGREQNCLKCEN